MVCGWPKSKTFCPNAKKRQGEIIPLPFFMLICPHTPAFSPWPQSDIFLPYYAWSMHSPNVNSSFSSKTCSRSMMASSVWRTDWPTATPSLAQAAWAPRISRCASAAKRLAMPISSLAMDSSSCALADCRLHGCFAWQRHAGRCGCIMPAWDACCAA